jgi:hypothetical protein
VRYKSVQTINQIKKTVDVKSLFLLFHQVLRCIVPMEAGSVLLLICKCMFISLVIILVSFKIVCVFFLIFQEQGDGVSSESLGSIQHESNHKDSGECPEEADVVFSGGEPWEATDTKVC